MKTLDLKQDGLSENPSHRRELLVERLLRDSMGGLTESELLELLLSFAEEQADGRQLAAKLLQTFGGLTAVLDASVVEFRSVTGMGLYGSALVRVVREIVNLCSQQPQLPSEVLARPEELVRYLLARMGPMKMEAILLLFLNSQGILLGEELISTGTLNKAAMFPRQVMERVLHYNAAALVLVHNHPHGPPLPSVRDREEAEMLRDVLRPFDVKVLDAVVVGQNRCFSIFRNVPL